MAARRRTPFGRDDAGIRYSRVACFPPSGRRRAHSRIRPQFSACLVRLLRPIFLASSTTSCSTTINLQRLGNQTPTWPDIAHTSPCQSSSIARLQQSIFLQARLHGEEGQQQSHDQWHTVRSRVVSVGPRMTAPKNGMSLDSPSSSFSSMLRRV